MKKIVKENSYFSVRSESRNILNLKGNDLLIFSIIESIALSNEFYLFGGSLKYLVNWTGLTKQTVINVLNKLVERKILIKYIDKDYKNRDKPYYRLNIDIYG